MRKTKIICTLGPSTDNPAVMKRLMKEGMNVARFNFSHGTHQEHLDRLKMVPLGLVEPSGFPTPPES